MYWEVLLRSRPGERSKNREREELHCDAQLSPHPLGAMMLGGPLEMSHTEAKRVESLYPHDQLLDAAAIRKKGVTLRRVWFSSVQAVPEEGLS